jgi:DNA helicase-2/ATP-dependent DNA helicase PcrA
LITVNAYFKNPEIMEADERANMKYMGQIYQKYVEQCSKMAQWILMIYC